MAWPRAGAPEHPRCPRGIHRARTEEGPLLTTRTNLRTPAAHAALPETRKGTGFRSHKLFDQLGVRLDPFVSLEHFHMDDVTFTPHPHAGFSAVTYLLGGSPGAIRVRESGQGDRRLAAVEAVETGLGDARDRRRCRVT